MTSTINKSTKLSEVVQEILFIKGYDKIFNWQDYHYFKEQTSEAIHRAHEIANLFISETNELSDFADYEF